MDATSLTTALAPAFAAGFAVQRLLEILDPLAEWAAGAEKKKIVLGLSSLVAGLGFAGGVGIRVLVHLGAYTFGRRWDRHDLVDLFVTGLVISAGTEGFNSILKFMNYKKEESKAAALTGGSAKRNLAATKGRITQEDTMNTDITSMDEDFTPGDAINIAYKSVTTTTGSGEPVSPLKTLEEYGTVQQDIPTIRSKVITNQEFGLPKYGRTMNPNALKDLNTGWTLQKLADITFDDSQPV